MNKHRDLEAELREQGIFLYENCTPFLFAKTLQKSYQRSSIPDGSKTVCFLSQSFSLCSKLRTWDEVRMAIIAEKTT